jgi:cephalosporin-C deacetylase-like acetyl esterase
MNNPYNYKHQNIVDSLSLIEDTTSWSRYSVEFESSWPAQYLGNSRVKGEYFYPKGAKSAPLAILVHGMGARSVIPCKLIAHTLGKKGIASFVLYLIFHKYRVSEPIITKYPRLSTEEWFESYQISVNDIRQVIDWAHGRPELNIDDLAVVGISYGGFIAAISMALDKHIKAGIFIVMGGNSEKITRHSTFLRWTYKHNESTFKQNQEAYRRFLAEIDEKGLENVEAGKRSYLTDPMSFARYLRNRPVLMLNAMWDEMIPRIATTDLWEACGKPSISWYPATHASIWLWYPFISSRISRFLKSSLK